VNHDDADATRRWAALLMAEAKHLRGEYDAIIATDRASAKAIMYEAKARIAVAVELIAKIDPPPKHKRHPTIH